MMTTCPVTSSDTATRGKRSVAGAGGGAGGAGGDGTAVVDGEGTGEGDGDISPVGDGVSVLDSAPAVRRAAVDTWPQPATAPTISPAVTSRLAHLVRSRNPTTTGDTGRRYGRPYAWG